MSPVKLEVVCTWPGGPRLERWMHRRFAEHRQHGEWFDLPAGWVAQADELSDMYLRHGPHYDWERHLRRRSVVPEVIDYDRALTNLAVIAGGRP